MEILGIDVGGSGIKGAIVDTITGELLSERHRIPTPQPSTPDNVADTVGEIVNHFNWNGLIGCSFPSIVKDGVCHSAGNISDQWIGVPIDKLFTDHCKGHQFVVGNDADLAGIAEMEMGVGRGKNGLILIITIGTGLGSGLFYNGVLVPNFELGHVYYLNGEPIENWAADSARKREGLSVEEWSDRFDFFLNHVDRLCSPDHFIIGGGISKKFDQYKDHLTTEVPVHIAEFRNNAGIVGAALYARDCALIEKE